MRARTIPVDEVFPNDEVAVFFGTPTEVVGTAGPLLLYKKQLFLDVATLNGRIFQIRVSDITHIELRRKAPNSRKDIPRKTTFKRWLKERRWAMQ